MPTDLPSLLLAFAAGILGGAMIALAGGGTFVTLPALIALGLPANVANGTSNVALLPGRGEWLVLSGRSCAGGGVSVREVGGLAFGFGLVGRCCWW